MDTTKFYESLRPEDGEQVKRTVNALKAKGFEVYVTGSSLEHAFYNDIDLVAKPQEGMTQPDARAGLDAVVDRLKMFGASVAYTNDEITDRYALRFDQSIMPQDDYVQSNVTQRKSLSFGPTKIDISIAYEPFGLQPQTKNMKL